MVALYDAKEKRKISESFHLDCNSSDIQHMLDDHWDERSMASLSRSAIFNITYPNPDVFLIVKVSTTLCVCVCVGGGGGGDMDVCGRGIGGFVGGGRGLLQCNLVGTG